jgi:hypothetical protein
MDRVKSGKVALLEQPGEYGRANRIERAEHGPSPGPSGFPARSPMGAIWGRINTDIATFLAAMDSLSSEDSEANYEALLAATDRLLWAAARTRLELERVLGSRKKLTSLRPVSG